MFPENDFFNNNFLSLRFWFPKIFTKMVKTFYFKNAQKFPNFANGSSKSGSEKIKVSPNIEFHPNQMRTKLNNLKIGNGYAHKSTLHHSSTLVHEWALLSRSIQLVDYPNLSCWKTLVSICPPTRCVWESAQVVRLCGPDDPRPGSSLLQSEVRKDNRRSPVQTPDGKKIMESEER